MLVRFFTFFIGITTFYVFSMSSLAKLSTVDSILPKRGIIDFKNVNQLPFLDTQEMLATKITMLQTQKPDCVVFGTSRALLIDPAQLTAFQDCVRPFNASIWGGSYYTSLVMAYFIKEQKFKKAIWIWNPAENLNSKYGEKLFLKSHIKTIENEMSLSFFDLSSSFDTIKDYFRYEMVKNFFHFQGEKNQNLTSVDKNSKMLLNGQVIFSDSFAEALKQGQNNFIKEVQSLLQTIDVNSQQIKFKKWCEIFGSTSTSVISIRSSNPIMNEKFDVLLDGLKVQCPVLLKTISPDEHCEENDSIDGIHYKSKCMTNLMNQVLQ